MLKPVLSLVISSLLAAQAVRAEDQTPSVHIYDGLKEQFTIALPEGWTVYDQTAALTGKPSTTGMVFFTAEPLLAPGQKVIPLSGAEALAKVERGDVPAFFVDRGPATRGMSCSKLTRRAESQVEELVSRDEIFRQTRGLLLLARPKVSQIELAGCQALKITGSAPLGPEKTPWSLDVRAVSDGKIMYLFHIRTTDDNFLKNLLVFEAALATLHFPSQAAPPGR